MLNFKLLAEATSFLCLYRPVCVGPVRNRHCWFSHKAAQIKVTTILFLSKSKTIQVIMPFLVILRHINVLDQIQNPKVSFMMTLLK